MIVKVYIGGYTFFSSNSSIFLPAFDHYLQMFHLILDFIKPNLENKVALRKSLEVTRKTPVRTKEN